MAIHDDPIRLTSEQIQLLSEWCARTGLPAEQLLSEALRAYEGVVPRGPNGASGGTLLDRLSRTGLLGCLAGGPEDLSTNPEHMKGFGE